VDLREIGGGSMGLSHLVQGKDQCRAVVNMEINFWVP
jgi:hypothetical protein